MKEKHDTLDAMLSTPNHTQIHINATYPGVQVPPEHKDNEALVLNLSRRFGMSISLDHDAVRTELSFHGRVQPVIIPWEALWGISKGESNIVWQESMPTKVLLAWQAHKTQVDAYNEQQRLAKEKAEAERQSRIKKSGLKLV